MDATVEIKSKIPGLYNKLQYYLTSHKNDMNDFT